jgi:hypothetical protein
MKGILRLLSILVLSMVFSSGMAQTSLDLKALRHKPDSTTLGIVKPVAQLEPIALAVSSLDLNVIYWRHWSSFGVNANQASFSDNWNAGGVNSISVGGIINHKSDFTKNNTTFVTELALQYGKIKNKDQSARKSNDRLFWDNKLSLKIAKNWSLFTSLTFETQFDNGFKYDKKKDGSDSLILISNFMAPGYLTESFGVEYKRDKTFSLRIGTGTARQTFILDKRLAPTEATGPRFGVAPGETFKNDLAFQLTANLDKNLTETINLKSRYNLFANYKKISDPAHRLDATITARVTRLINVTFNGILIYDTTVDAKMQASQTLALGLLYKIPR